jgi:hypothetical protein
MGTTTNSDLKCNDMDMRMLDGGIITACGSCNLVLQKQDALADPAFSSLLPRQGQP